MTDVQNIEVEGQGFAYSDENLKQAIQQLENALGALGKLSVARESAAEVEGQKFVSDENLKQAIQQVENALAVLRDLDTKKK